MDSQTRVEKMMTSLETLSVKTLGDVLLWESEKGYVRVYYNLDCSLLVFFFSFFSFSFMYIFLFVHKKKQDDRNKANWEKQIHKRAGSTKRQDWGKKWYVLYGFCIQNLTYYLLF